MAIRYTAKMFGAYRQMREIVNKSDMSEQDKQEMNTLIAYLEGYTQAGHLIGCGRSHRAFEVLTGLTSEQMRETAQFKELSKLDVGETICISCPRDWYNFIRSLLKSEDASRRYRAKETKDEDLMVTRIK